MSALHSRLPDAGSIGPGIHSSSERQRLWRPEAKRDLRDLRTPDLPQNEYTSVQFLTNGGVTPSFAVLSP